MYLYLDFDGEYFSSDFGGFESPFDGFHDDFPNGFSSFPEESQHSAGNKRCSYLLNS